jgi:broad specificity phosphatase PhoE
VERAILVRHAESEYNARGLVNGDPKSRVGLTPAGTEQARRLGELLAAEEIDLCVTSGLERTRLTADLALGDRPIPRLVVKELNDPLYGPFEGSVLERYRVWAAGASSMDSPGRGGESRQDIVRRYVIGFRQVIARPETTILVVIHSLPIAYAISAREQIGPRPRIPLTAYATPYYFTNKELDVAASVMQRWLSAPDW